MVYNDSTSATRSAYFPQYGGIKKWYLLLGNCEYDSNNLETLEQLLYDWAIDEGYEV